MLIFIVGLQAEARLLPFPTQVGRIPAGATALVSFGLAGGLAPSLQPGDVLVPRAVLWRGERYAADPDLSKALGGFSCEALLASEVVVADKAAKARRFAATGAEAVDMESGLVAEAGLPFAVLRAVCDPAWRDLPPAALAALDRQGAIGFGRVLASVARHPGQIGGLLRLARDAARARRALVERVKSVRESGALSAWAADTSSL